MTTAPDVIVNLPLARLFPSALNPRKSFDDDKLAELASSIRANGLIEPIVVRPKDAGGAEPIYEIVAGERRYRAAKIAGVEAVAVCVRALDDAAAGEAMLVENLQRADLTPVEEANAFHAWISSQAPAKKAERLNWPKELGGKLGKSEDYIRERLVLLGLEDEVLTAVDAGNVKLKDAVALARSGIDGEDRKNILEMMRHPEPYDEVSEEIAMMLRSRKFKEEQAKARAAEADNAVAGGKKGESAAAKYRRESAAARKRDEAERARRKAAVPGRIAKWEAASRATWTWLKNASAEQRLAVLEEELGLDYAPTKDEVAMLGLPELKTMSVGQRVIAKIALRSIGFRPNEYSPTPSEAEKFCRRWKVEVPKEAPHAPKR